MRMRGTQKLSAVGVAVFALALLAPQPTRADGATTTVSGTYATSGVGIWGTQNSTISYQNFFGTSWNAGFNAGPGIGCDVVFGCFGSQLGVSTSGQLGVNVGFSADGGSMNAAIPASVGLGFPTTVAFGQSANITVDPVQYGLGLMNTTSASLQAYADLVLQARLDASLQVCAFGCFINAGGTLVNINTVNELASINRGGNGQVNVVGITAAVIGQPNNLPNGLGTVQVNFPQGSSGGGTSVLNSSASTSVLSLNIDATNVATNLLGVPALHGSFGSCPDGCLSYNVLTATASVNLLVNQSFSLTPSAELALFVAETGQTIIVPVGTNPGTISIPFPTGTNSLTIFPYLSLSGAFSNTTTVALNPYFSLSGGAGGFCLLSACAGFGPLFSSTFNLGTFDLFTQSFNSNFSLGVIAGQPFTIVQQTPEPATIALLGTGLSALGFLSRRRNRRGHGSFTVST